LWLPLAASALVAGCAASTVPPLFCLSESVKPSIATADGPEDMAALRLADGTYRLFVRVQNGIQTMELGPDGTPSPAPALPSDAVFDSLGLSLLPGDGSRPAELFAIDQGAHAVRRFTVRDRRLEPAGAAVVGSTLLPRPNDLLAVPREGGGDPDVYVSNPDVFWKRFWRGAWPSVVLLRAGEPPRAVVEDLGFANGIAADRGGKHLLVADYRAKRLVAYRRNDADGGLERLCHVRLPAMPDNLSVHFSAEPDDEGLVLVAAQDSLPLSALHLLVSSRFPSPSRVFAIRFSDLALPNGGSDAECRIKKPMAGGQNEEWPPLLWADGGAHVAAGSTAIRVDDRLLVSQIVRPGIHSFRCSPDAWSAPRAETDRRPVAGSWSLLAAPRS
jgi:hypothetical protein